MRIRLTRLPLLLLTVLAIGAGPLAAQVWEVRNTLLTLDGGSVADSEFGARTVAGDFDGDGRVDLAIASFQTDRVEIHRGAPGGLSPAPWTTLVGSQAGSYFGSALAAGDFDGDGRDELAIGARLYDVVAGVTIQNAGKIFVYGFDNGSWSQVGSFSQATSGVPGDAETDDSLGATMAVGDFDGDQFDDLAIGAPDEAVGSTQYAGAVNVLYGGASGLATDGAQLWYRSGGSIDGSAEFFAELGSSLAAGDFDADGADDLAIGAPAYWAGAGEVVVLYGVVAAGLSGTGQLQLDPMDFGDAAAEQNFGSALAAGDISRDSVCEYFDSCADDLAVGAPGQLAGDPAVHAGGVYLLFGSYSSGGLDPANVDRIDQSTLYGDWSSEPEANDGFGSQLAIGSIDRLRGSELAIGAPYEDFEGIGSTGCAHLLFGGSTDPDAKAEQFLFSRAGFRSSPQQNGDSFAAGLAIGDFDGDGMGDLAVSMPGRTVDGKSNAGAVQILYGAVFADGFESTALTSWTNF